jgi:single-strand DNA-binding protein
MQINKVILLGRVGKDPEVKYLESGIAVASLPLATSESYKNKSGERVTTTEWHNVVIWRKQAEIVEKYVKKGSELYIEGSLRTRSWEDKEGNKRYATEVVANKITLGRKPESKEEVPSEKTDEANQVDEFDNSPKEADDLPF